ncbi:unnamed protein product [Didymodactylos carnosus]|uniref:Uncharacterized protein n=2 Tax=Didymodactylos carnosus TaxID=1234261 RepID=A0A814CZM5_9BILA|nr:unnamed protein product [Didymodactylos carnosus]CAF3724927.1 unnamed protein product [Didymodactylos carnosus]
MRRRTLKCPWFFHEVSKVVPIIHDVSIRINDKGILRRLPGQTDRSILINPDLFEKPEVTLMCYNIQLSKDSKSFAYIFKNVDPTGIWYDYSIRDGDRLLTIANEDVTCMSHEDVYLAIVNKQQPFQIGITWHPELYLSFESRIVKDSIRQQKKIFHPIQALSLAQFHQTTKEDSMAKMLLLKEKEALIYHKTFSGMNMYDHISKLLRYLFDHRPVDPQHIFEELSRQLKKTPYVPDSTFNREKFKTNVDAKDSLDDRQQQKQESESSNTNKNEKDQTIHELALRQLEEKFTLPDDSEDTRRMRNALELHAMVEQIGCGISKEEIYWFAAPLQLIKVKFAKKLFADKDSFDDVDLNDHYFIEATEQSDRTEETMTESAVTEQDEEIGTRESAQKSKWKASTSVPPEQPGSGVNQKVYYVISKMNDDFIQLPMVTSDQIRLARSIRRLFTGNLESKVQSQPLFPGVEKHLLRAQVQRISAGTQLGPLNYFKLPNDDEEQEEVEDAPKTFVVDENFEGNALEDLILPNGEFWVHAVPYILPQGRNSFINPYRKPTHDERLNDESEAENEVEEAVERGPNLLTEVNHDSPIADMYPAWSISLSSALVPEHALVSVRSNRWPGAYTVGDRRRFKNFYVGWGLKNREESSLANLIMEYVPQNEFRDIEQKLIEIDDPIPENERSTKSPIPEEEEEDEDDIEEEF